MNSISQYGKMKDSGIKWIGKVPGHWSLRLLKYMFSIKKDIAGSEGYTVLSVTQKGIVPKKMSDKGQFAKDYSKYQLVHVGDFVMNHMDLLTGWIDVSSFEGVTSPDYRVFTNDSPDIYESAYYKYIFQHCYQNRIFYGLGQGVSGFGRWRLPANMFLNFHLPVPPLSEQNAIAAYLDDQCEQIDSLVQEAKDCIEEYKKWRAAIIFEAVTKGLDKSVAMRDSGVDWIGEVPTHWDLPKIKHITSKVGSGKTPRGGAEVYVNEGVLFLRSQNIYDEGLKLDNPYYITDDMDEEMCNTRVYANDVLLNITGGSIGRCCVYPNDIGNANVNQHVSIIRVNSSTITPEYMHLFWISPLGKNAINIYQTGGNREGMSAEAIKETPIPLPPLDEQIKTVNHIKPFINSIEEIINDKESLITDLESYKKSLIYETVTGKRKVVQS